MPDTAQDDLAHYGHVVDREKALAELHPTFAQVADEHPSSAASRAYRESWEIEKANRRGARVRVTAAEQEREADMLIAAWQRRERERRGRSAA